MSIKDKKSKQKTEDFDFDSQMDFGEFDFSDIDSKANSDIKDVKSRNPISSVFSGVVSGAATKFADPRFLSRTAESALPDEFSVVTSTIDKASSSFKSMYDESIREMKPQVAQLTRRINKLVPETSRTLKKITSKFDSMFNDSSGYVPQSIEEQQNQAIASSLSSIFQTQNERSLELEARENAKETIKDNIEKKRFDTNLQVMSAMNNNIAHLTSYNRTINQAFQKKSLELQYRSYFAQAELLKTTQKYFEIFKVQHDAISKNTALPEFVKLKESERFKELTRNKFYDSVREKLFGGTQEALENFIGNIKSKVKQKVGMVKEGFEEGFGALDMVEMMVEQNKAMEEAGMGNVSFSETVGQAAGGAGAEHIAKKLGKRAKRYLSENKEATEKIFKIVNMFQDLQHSARKGKDSDFVRKLQGEEGLPQKIAEMIVGVLDMVKPKAPDLNLGRSMHTLRDLNEPGFFSKKTERTINEIIPGYLALQLAELVQIRKKDKTDPKEKEKVVFDMKASKFVSKGVRNKEVEDDFKRKIRLNSNRSHLESFLKSIMGEQQLNSDDKQNILMLLNEMALSDGKSATSEDFRSTTTWRQLSDNKTEGFESFEKNLDEKLSSETSRNSLIRNLDSSRRSFADMRADIADMISAGDTEVIERLVSRDKDGNYTLKQPEYMKYISELTIKMSDQEIREYNENIRRQIEVLEGKLNSPGISNSEKDAIRKNIRILRGSTVNTSDVNVKTAFSKIDPRKALSAVKNTMVRKWKYKNSENKGDDDHIGPMAQDVKKNMGERAAPEGKSLNMIDLNGINMSAIQALNKQFEQSLKSDNSHKVLKSIDLKLSHSLKILSAIKKSSLVSASSNVAIRMEEGGSSETNRGKRILKDLSSLSIDGAAKGITGAYGAAKSIYQYILNPAANATIKGAKMLKTPAGWLARKASKYIPAAIGKTWDIGKDLVTDKIPKAQRFVTDKVKSASELFSSKFKDIYIPGMLEVPALRAQLLKMGYYIDKETGKAIETLDDIKGDIVDRSGNLILSIEEMKNGFVDKKGEAIKGFASKVFDKAKKGVEYIYEKGKDIFNSTLDFVKGKFDPNTLMGKIAGGIGSMFQAVTGTGMGNKTYRVLLDIRDILRKGRKIKLRSDEDEKNDEELKKKFSDAKEKIGKFLNKEELSKKVDDVKNMVSSAASFVLGEDKAKELRNRWTNVTSRENFQAQKEKFFSAVDSAVKDVKEKGIKGALKSKVDGFKQKLSFGSADPSGQMDMFGGTEKGPGFFSRMRDWTKSKLPKRETGKKESTTQDGQMDMFGGAEKGPGFFSRMKNKASGYLDKKLENSSKYQSAKTWVGNNKDKIIDKAGGFIKGAGSVVGKLFGGAVGSGEQGVDPNLTNHKSSLFHKAWSLANNNSLTNRFKKDDLRQQAREEEKQNELKALQEGGPAARYKTGNIFDGFLDKLKGIWDIGKNIVGGAVSLFGMMRGAGLFKALFSAGGAAAAAGTGGALAGTAAAGAAAAGTAGATVATGAAAAGTAATGAAAGAGLWAGLKAMGATAGKSVLTGFGGLKNIGMGALRLVPAMAVGGTKLAVGAGVGLAKGLIVGGTWLAGAALSSIGAIISSPVLMTTLALVGTAYAANAAYKYFTRNSADIYEKIRFAQYGFHGTEDEKHFHKLKELEKYLCDGSHIRFQDTKASLMNIDTEKVLKMFDLNQKSEKEMNDFIRWFHLRFKPFFLHSVAVLRGIDKSKTILELTKMDRRKQLAYLEKVQMQNGPYNVEFSPVKEKESCKDNQSLVASMKDDRLSELRREIKEKGLDDISAQKTPEEKKLAKATTASIKKMEDNDPNSKSPSSFMKVKTNFTDSKELMKDQKKYAEMRKKELEHLLSEGEDGQELSGVSETDTKNLTHMKMPKVASGSLADGKEGMKYIKFAKKEIDISGLNPALFKNLMMMAQEYGEATGKSVMVTSGYRSYAQQAAEYKANPKGAAKPGTSLHEFGLAIDIDQRDLAKLEEMGLMRKYGFTRPIGGEPWHTEPAGIQSVLSKVKTDQDLASKLIENSILRGGGGVGTMPNAPKWRRNIDIATALYKAGGEKVDDVKKEYEKISGELSPLGKDEKKNSSISSASTTPEGMSGYVSRAGNRLTGNDTPTTEPAESNPISYGKEDKYVGNTTNSPYMTTASYTGGISYSQTPTRTYAQGSADNPSLTYSYSTQPVAPQTFTMAQTETPRSTSSFNFAPSTPTAKSVAGPVSPAASTGSVQPKTNIVGAYIPESAVASWGNYVSTTGSYSKNTQTETPRSTSSFNFAPSTPTAKSVAGPNSPSTVTNPSVPEINLAATAKLDSKAVPSALVFGMDGMPIGVNGEITTKGATPYPNQILKGDDGKLFVTGGTVPTPGSTSSTVTGSQSSTAQSGSSISNPTPSTAGTIASLEKPNSVTQSTLPTSKISTPVQNRLNTHWDNGDISLDGNSPIAVPSTSKAVAGPTIPNTQLSTSAVSQVSNPTTGQLGQNSYQAFPNSSNPYMQQAYGRMNPYSGYRQMYGQFNPYMQQAYGRMNPYSGYRQMYGQFNPYMQQGYGYQNQFQDFGTMLRNHYKIGVSDFKNNLTSGFAENLIKDLDMSDPKVLNDPKYIAYMSLVHGADPKMMFGNSIARQLAGQGEVGQFGADVWRNMSMGNMSFGDALKLQGKNMLLGKVGQMFQGNNSPMGTFGSDVMSLAQAGIPLKDAIKYQGASVLMDKGFGFMDKLFGYQPNNYSQTARTTDSTYTPDALGDFINGIGADRSSYQKTPVVYNKPTSSNSSDMDYYARLALTASGANNWDDNPILGGTETKTSNSVSKPAKTSTISASRQGVMDQIYDLAQKTGSDPRDLLTKVASESGFNVGAERSDVKVHGLFQIHENNWKGWKGKDGIVRGGWAKDKAFTDKLKENGIDPKNIDFKDPLTNYLMAEKHNQEATATMKSQAGYDLPSSGPMSYLFHVAGGGERGIKLAKAIQNGNLDIPADQILGKEVLSKNPFLYNGGKASNGVPTLKELINNTEKHYTSKTGEFKIDDYLSSKQKSSSKEYDDGASAFKSNKKVSYDLSTEEPDEEDFVLPPEQLKNNWENILRLNEESKDEYNVDTDASSLFGSKDDDEDSGGGFFSDLFGGVKDTVSSGFNSLFGSDNDDGEDSGGGFFSHLFGGVKDVFSGVKDSFSSGMKEIFGGNDLNSVGSSLFQDVKDSYAQTRNQMFSPAGNNVFGSNRNGSMNPYMARAASANQFSSSMGPAMQSLLGGQFPVDGDAYMPAMDSRGRASGQNPFGSQFAMPGFSGFSPLGMTPINVPGMPYFNPNQQLMFPGQQPMGGLMGNAPLTNNPFALIPPGAGMGYGQLSGQAAGQSMDVLKTGIDKTNTLLETNNQQNDKILEAISKIADKIVGQELITQIGQAIVEAISQASGKAVSTSMPAPTQSRAMSNIGVSMDRTTY